MKFKDYYEALGLERDATLTQIKQAYRKLAHKYHPDVSKDAAGEDKFKEIAEAYATLKDPEKRQAYDELGQRRPGEDFEPPQGWRPDFAGSESGYADVDLADLLAAFAARQGGGPGASGFNRAARPRRGEDYEVTASVTLEQVFHGAEIDVSVALPERDAKGLVHRVPRTFRVRIPRGASDKQRLRLGGKGGPGAAGGEAGDLYVAIELKPHALYRVSGADLSMDLPLAPWEAALGATVTVPTLAGAVELKVASGTASGRRLRLAKRGLPNSTGAAGDLYAVVRVDVPKQLSARERELFESLAETSKFDAREDLYEGAL